MWPRGSAATGSVGHCGGFVWRPRQLAGAYDPAGVLACRRPCRPGSFCLRERVTSQLDLYFLLLLRATIPLPPWWCCLHVQVALSAIVYSILSQHGLASICNTAVTLTGESPSLTTAISWQLRLEAPCPATSPRDILLTMHTSTHCSMLGSSSDVWPFEPSRTTAITTAGHLCELV